MAPSEGITGPMTRRYLFRTFLLALVVVLVALVALSAMFYRSNRRFLLESLEETNQIFISDVSRLLDDVLFRASYASAAIARRADIAAYLQPDVRIGADPSEMDLLTLLSLFAESTRDIYSVVLYSTIRDQIVTDRVIVPRELYPDDGWIDELVLREEPGPFLRFRLSDRFDERLVSIVRKIVIGNEVVGALAVNIQVDSIRRLLGQYERQPDEDILVVHKDGTVVFSFHDNLLGTVNPGSISNTGPLVTSASGALFNVTYYAIRGNHLLDQIANRLIRFLAALAVAVLVSGMMVALVLSNVTYRPIRLIMDTIRNPDRHQSSATDRTSDEVRFIEDSILQIIVSNRQLQDRLAERYSSFQKSHYAALQLQMNPHFLHNTLESIYWWSLESMSPEATFPKAVSALSRFLRGVLSTDSMIVPLREETGLTMDYVRVLQARFPDKVEVRWEVPEEMTKIPVPKLILQPLVENAFYHGLKPTGTAGCITVAAKRSEDSYTVLVSDNGIGIKPERLESLRADLSSDPDIVSDHIGLKNISQRLRILFGAKASVEIESQPKQGTTVSVRIPQTTPAEVPVPDGRQIPADSGATPRS